MTDRARQLTAATPPVPESLDYLASGAAGRALSATRSGALLVALGLYGLALAIRLWAISLMSQPLTEGSSYYVAVARNVVTGRGLAIDAIWSYATPPLTLPRPAFELWQPMASLVATLPMAMFGPTFSAAQLGFAMLGALLAPLAWLVARDAARRMALPVRRAQAVTIGAGVLTAVSAPLLVATAVPDSTLPFTVAALAACLLMPRALAGDRRFLVALGAALGLAYLTRMEAVWFGLAFVVASLWTGRSVRHTVARATLVAGVAALMAVPWWLRNVAVFGTPLPGQLADNLFLTRNEQIFGYLDRPTLDSFLAQGASALLGNIGAALWHDLVNVLVVPGAPAAMLGLAAVAVGLRRRGRRQPATLGLVLLAGALCYGATSVLFPVATLWGTFEHAAGPLHVALVVAALIGTDALVARVREWRRWPRSNAWLSPVGLVLITLPLTVWTLTGAAANAQSDAQRIDQLARALPTALDGAIDGRAPLIADRPIWLSDALGQPVIILPDEPPAALAQLAADFEATAIVMTEPRGDLPAALRGASGSACFVEQDVAGLPATGALFLVRESCR